MASLKQTIQKKMPGVVAAYHFVWAWLVARRQKHPSEKIFVIGITGTKGKTTTLELLNAILEAAGKRTALLSSIRMKIADTNQKNETSNSMPGHGYIQKFLRRARAMDCGYALVEVTSQGVAMHRHRFIDWNMAVLTNLHPEHIESHGSFENYRAAKLAFLQYTLERGGKVFLNRDDKNFDFFAASLAHASERTIEVSATEPWLKDRITKSLPMAAVAGEPSPKFFMSRFNEENIAIAAAVARELGISDRTIEEAIANFEGVPGRMEFVTAGPYMAIVDYAHTPESLEAAYQAARSLFPENENDSDADESAAGKLICILGAAGGGRDTWKRPEFGKIAAHYCDEIILTNEDPYDENPEAIMDAIASGVGQMPYPRPEVTKILDRREAFEKAIDMMGENDIVIATGKGSEDWIHVANGKKIAWNEKAVAQEVLAEKR